MSDSSHQEEGETVEKQIRGRQGLNWRSKGYHCVWSSRHLRKEFDPTLSQSEVDEASNHMGKVPRWLVPELL